MSRKPRTTAKRHRKIQARLSTVIYTLFGAYVVPRGGEVHVIGLLKLVIPLGFSANAIRLGLSRMSRQGVFRIRRAGRCSYYSLSEKGMKWMEQGKVRAFETEHRPWDGKWRLVVYNVPERLRGLRDRLRSKLLALGFAKLSASVWIAPHDVHKELDQYIRHNGIAEYVETFIAEYSGKRDQRELAAAIWDIAELSKRYRVFVNRYENLRLSCDRSAKRGDQIDSAECFSERFCMTAEYVALRLEDPMLPLEILPDNWIGIKARRLYDDLLKMLRPRSDEFVDSVLNE